MAFVISISYSYIKSIIGWSRIICNLRASDNNNLDAQHHHALGAYLFRRCTETSDFNTMTDYGIYMIGTIGSKSNSPSGLGNGNHGFMINYTWSSGRIIQVLFVGYGGYMIYMRHYVSNSWDSWTKVV